MEVPLETQPTLPATPRKRPLIFIYDLPSEVHVLISVSVSGSASPLASRPAPPGTGLWDQEVGGGRGLDGISLAHCLVSCFFLLLACGDITGLQNLGTETSSACLSRDAACAQLEPITRSMCACSSTHGCCNIGTQAQHASGAAVSQ